MDFHTPYISSSISNSINSLAYFLPELNLAIGFCLVILVQLFFSKKGKNHTFFSVIFVLAISLLFTYQQFVTVSQATYLFGDMLVYDKLAVLFKFIFLLSSFLFVFFIRLNKSLQIHAKGTGDIYAILIAVNLGMNLMAMSSNLLMVYLSMEMVSFGSYLMVGYTSNNEKQTEAALKYVLFGAVCSAIMLYGLSIVYGLSGTLAFQSEQFSMALASANGAIIVISLIFIGFGIGFKLSAVPFHFWSPDVYEGAPTPVTAFLSTGVKAAGFALLIRLLWSQIETVDFVPVLSVIAMLTMIAGNFAAIWQNNVKRMLAYSSIGHTGFLLMAVIIYSESSVNAMLFYLFVYVLMNMAAFMIASKVEELSGAENNSDYKGFGKHFRWLMLAFAITLVSLTGLPPTGGFFAKLLVFSSTIEGYSMTSSPWLLMLLITGSLTTVVSLFYYFKIPLNAYLRQGSTQAFEKENGSSLILIWLLVITVLLAGLFPQVFSV